MDIMNAISDADGRTGRVKFSGFQQSYHKANYEATSEQNNFITGDFGESFWEFKFYDNEIQMTYNRGGGVVDEERLQEVIPQATQDQLNGYSCVLSHGNFTHLFFKVGINIKVECSETRQ